MSPRCSKKSIVWEFFNKNYENGKIKSVQCKNCNANYKYFGNTTNLKDHLKRKHPIQLAESEARQNPTDDTDNSELVDSSLSSSVVVDLSKINQSSTTTQSVHAKELSEEVKEVPEHPSKKLKQMKLYGARQKSEPSNDERHEFEKDLVHMIAADCQPLSIVENRGFKFFVKKYVPHHKLPSRKTLSESVLPEVYESLSSSLKNMLDSVEYLSITTDMWSSDSNRCFITVTAHFICEFKMRSFVLATEEVKTDHTAASIANAITDILVKWRIEEKIVTIVTDNAANMKKAVIDELKKYHHPCIAHTLNLSIQDAIKGNEELNSLLSKCRSLITHFKQSNLAAYKLREIQQQMGLSEIKLKQDVPTRWNSAVIMMQRLSEMKLPLSAALSSLVNAPNNLNASEWEAIDDCVEILKLFLYMTEDLSGEMYPTISRITPLIKGLTTEIENRNITTNIAAKLKTSLLEIVSKRFKFLEEMKTVAKATFLDPRFKKDGFESENDGNEAQNLVIEELCEIIQYSDESDNPNLLNPETIIPKKSDKDELWKHFDKKISEKSSTITPTDTATTIVKQYIEIPHLDRKKDPLEFWKSQSNVFPELYILASKYLSIPATSVPAERLFSKAAIITNNRRNRLSPKKLDELLFINENMELNI